MPPPHPPKKRKEALVGGEQEVVTFKSAMGWSWFFYSSVAWVPLWVRGGCGGGILVWVED